MPPPLNPAGLVRRIPLLPHQMVDRQTKTPDVIVLCHLGVPQLNVETWRLEVDGLVERPIELSFERLRELPKVEIDAVHQCAGSPLQPAAPSRRVSNVTWTGARLSDLLSLAGPMATARYLWSMGADYGAFEGADCSSYVKDLPLVRANDDVLIAYELNGEPLPPEHGFPARLIVPGFYGTNSVKWLTRLILAKERAESPFTTRWYNDPIHDDNGHATGLTKPVWSIAPQSIIVEPAPGALIQRGALNCVRGWAWGDGGVAHVELSLDAGLSWLPAELEPIRGRTWQAFSLDWKPQISGEALLMARATNCAGDVQPFAGHRNAIHQVRLTVA